MGKKVLIVDDDTYLRDLYEEVLKDAGYEVFKATDGEMGLSELMKGGYDLTLLDIMMPKKNGLEVLQALSQVQPRPQNGAILVLTNLAQDPVVSEALKTGASSYLVKADITPDQLVAKVKEFLK